jgi:hypothetical protein
MAFAPAPRIGGWIRSSPRAIPTAAPSAGRPSARRKSTRAARPRRCGRHSGTRLERAGPVSAPPVTGATGSGRAGHATDLRADGLGVFGPAGLPAELRQEASRCQRHGRQGERTGRARMTAVPEHGDELWRRAIHSGCAAAGGSTGRAPSAGARAPHSGWSSGSSVAIVIPDGISIGPVSRSKVTGARVKRAMMERCARRVDSRAQVSARPASPSRTCFGLVRMFQQVDQVPPQRREEVGHRRDVNEGHVEADARRRFAGWGISPGAHDAIEQRVLVDTGIVSMLQPELRAGPRCRPGPCAHRPCRSWRRGPSHRDARRPPNRPAGRTPRRASRSALLPLRPDRPRRPTRPGGPDACSARRDPPRPPRPARRRRKRRPASTLRR